MKFLLHALYETSKLMAFKLDFLCETLLLMKFQIKTKNSY